MGGDTINNGNFNASAAVINTLVGTTAQRAINAGANKELKFTFLTPASTSQAAYSITVEFGPDCSVHSGP